MPTSLNVCTTLMDAIQRRIELLRARKQARLAAREALRNEQGDIIEPTEQDTAKAARWTVPLSAIPNEVTDVIVDFLHDDIKALGTCCLISRAFIPSSRYHLYKELTLDDKSSRELLGILSSPFCTIIPFVHTLCVKLLPRWPDETWKKTTIPQLRKLSNARTLHLCGEPLGWKRHASKIGADLLPLFAWLTELKITTGRFESFAQFVDVLCAWPSLECLYIGQVDLLTPSFPAPTLQHHRLATNIRFLHIRDLPELDRFLSFLLLYEAELSIHTLVLTTYTIFNIPLINTFLRALGPALKTLTLSM
jgi:hypothetical protein